MNDDSEVALKLRLPSNLFCRVSELAKEDFCSCQDIINRACARYVRDRTECQRLKELEEEVQTLRREVDHLYNPENPL